MNAVAPKDARLAALLSLPCTPIGIYYVSVPQGLLASAVLFVLLLAGGWPVLLAPFIMPAWAYYAATQHNAALPVPAPVVLQQTAAAPAGRCPKCLRPGVTGASFCVGCGHPMAG